MSVASDAFKSRLLSDKCIRGHGVAIKNGMTAAIQRLMDWVFLDLEAESMLARVFSDNRAVLLLHRRNGLREEKRVLLVRIDEGDSTRWVESPEMPAAETSRQIVYLRIARRGYRPLNVPIGRSIHTGSELNER